VRELDRYLTELVASRPLSRWNHMELFALSVVRDREALQLDDRVLKRNELQGSVESRRTCLYCAAEFSPTSFGRATTERRKFTVSPVHRFHVYSRAMRLADSPMHFLKLESFKSTRIASMML
jgi:hypothetical protein